MSSESCLLSASDKESIAAALRSVHAILIRVHNESEGGSSELVALDLVCSLLRILLDRFCPPSESYFDG